MDAIWHEKGRLGVTLVAIVLCLLFFSVLPGCAGVPQDGIVGMAYCGQDEPLTAGYCLCTHELRVSAMGFTCVELDSGTLTEVVPNGD